MDFSKTERCRCSILATHWLGHLEQKPCQIFPDSVFWRLFSNNLSKKKRFDIEYRFLVSCSFILEMHQPYHIWCSTRCPFLGVFWYAYLVFSAQCLHDIVIRPVISWLMNSQNRMRYGMNRLRLIHTTYGSEWSDPRSQFNRSSWPNFDLLTNGVIICE